MEILFYYKENHVHFRDRGHEMRSEATLRCGKTSIERFAVGQASKKATDRTVSKSLISIISFGIKNNSSLKLMLLPFNFFSSFSLTESKPRELQITAYKQLFAYAQNCFAANNILLMCN